MRRAVFASAGVPAVISQQLNPGITWAGWRLPVGMELGVLLAVGVVMLCIAVRQFARSN